MMNLENMSDDFKKGYYAGLDDAIAILRDVRAGKVEPSVRTFTVESKKVEPSVSTYRIEYKDPHKGTTPGMKVLFRRQEGSADDANEKP